MFLFSTETYLKCYAPGILSRGRTLCQQAQRAFQRWHIGLVWYISECGILKNTETTLVVVCFFILQKLFTFNIISTTSISVLSLWCLAAKRWATMNSSIGRVMRGQNNLLLTACVLTWVLQRKLFISLTVSGRKIIFLTGITQKNFLCYWHLGMPFKFLY